MIAPRPYQVEALNKIYADLQVKQNVLLSGMMGCGKTFMSVRLIQRLYNESPEMKFLVLMHKQELCMQFFESFQKFTSIPFIDVGLCCAGLGEKVLNRRITIASIQTFVKRMNKYSGAGLIIVDEAHRIEVNSNTQYKQVFDYLRLQRPQCRLLGITATPYRLGHGYIYGHRCKPGSVNLFDEISHKITYSDLMKDGYLVPLKGVVANHESLGADLAGVSTNGDYVLDQLGEIMSREIHLQTAVEAIEKYCDGYKRVCVFCCTIDHAEKLREMIGERATIVHSRLSSVERTGNMSAWERGEKPIMTSVNILTEGFDLPVLDCLVFARPTLSTALFLQAVGRVLRTCEGKDHGLLVDLTDNTARFGTDLDNVTVNIPKSVADDIVKDKAMWKICPECDVEVHKALRECPECGFQWPENECVIAEALPAMKEVKFESTPKMEPVWFDVENFIVTEHESKKNGKMLGRVDFFYEESPYKIDNVSMFLCFADHYTGYAVQMSQKKWMQISGDTFPVSIDDFFAKEIYVPTRIRVDLNGKYPDLVDVEVDRDRFVVVTGVGEDAVEEDEDMIPF